MDSKNSKNVQDDYKENPKAKFSIENEGKQESQESSEKGKQLSDIIIVLHPNHNWISVNKVHRRNSYQPKLNTKLDILEKEKRKYSIKSNIIWSSTEERKSTFEERKSTSKYQTQSENNMPFEGRRGSFSIKQKNRKQSSLNKNEDNKGDLKEFK